MKKSIMEYVNYIDKLLKKKSIDNLDEVINSHLIKIFSGQILLANMTGKGENRFR